MRVLAMLLISLVGAASGFGCCLSYTPRGRTFFSGTSYFARATALSSEEFLVTEIFRGNLTVGTTVSTIDPDASRDTVTVSSDEGCTPKPVKGRDYVIAGGGETSVPRYVPWQASSEFVTFLRALHVITTTDLLHELTEWQAGQLRADIFLEWIRTADTQNRVHRKSGSLLVEALNSAEFLVVATDTADSCNPALSQLLRGEVVHSLTEIVRDMPGGDPQPPLQADVGNPEIDRYNPVYWRLDDWKQELEQRPTHDAIRECWNANLRTGPPRQLLPQ